MRTSVDIQKDIDAVETILKQGYVGGMTEYRERRREHLYKELQQAQMHEWNL